MSCGTCGNGKDVQWAPAWGRHLCGWCREMRAEQELAQTERRNELRRAARAGTAGTGTQAGCWIWPAVMASTRGP